MPRFAFEARDGEGRTRRATQDAASETALLEQLRASGLLTLRVERAGERREAAPSRELGGRALAFLFPPRSLDVEIGLQQLAFMLKSGLPLVLALETCAAQSSRRSMARTWNAVSERVQQGGSLSDALAAHRCFPALVVSMASVGEHTGELDEVLLRASAAMESRRNLFTAVATALTYPAIVFVMAIGVVAYMMVGLIPKLTKFLAAFNRRLPPMTQLLIDVSTFAQAHVVHATAALLAAVVAFAVLYRWRPARLVLDRLFLALPIVGSVLRLAGTATLARGLGSLVASGVRLTDALRVVEPLLSNRWLGRHVELARERVLQGSSLAEPLAASGGFLPMLPSMVAVGETSGTLDEVLDRVAEFHEARLEAVIRRLASLIEPVVLVVVGGVVGFIYMAFFMALYAMVGVR